MCELFELNDSIGEQWLQKSTELSPLRCCCHRDTVVSSTKLDRPTVHAIRVSQMPERRGQKRTKKKKEKRKHCARSLTYSLSMASTLIPPLRLCSHPTHLSQLNASLPSTLGILSGKFLSIDLRIPPAALAPPFLLVTCSPFHTWKPLNMSRVGQMIYPHLMIKMFQEGLYTPQ